MSAEYSYTYTLYQRMPALFAGVAIIGFVCLMSLTSQGFHLSRGMIMYFGGILLIGVLECCLRAFRGTPKKVLLKDSFLIIEGWVCKVKIPFSSIVRIEWDRGQAIISKMYSERFEISLDTGQRYRVNGFFKKGPDSFARELRNLNLQVDEYRRNGFLKQKVP